MSPPPLRSPPPPTGFSEDTADNICSLIDASSTKETPALDTWKNLCDQAGIGLRTWITQAQAPGVSSTPPLSLPQTNLGDYLQSKKIADARLYWLINKQDILNEIKEGGEFNPNFVNTFFPNMALSNFGELSDGAEYDAKLVKDKVGQLLKNKVYTCNSSNRTRSVSMNRQINLQKQGHNLPLRVGVPCEYGSEFPDDTFDMRYGTGSCGPQDVYCTGIYGPRTRSNCLRSCNCDAWPNPYPEIFPYVDHQRIENKNGPPHVVVNNPGLNRRNDGSYKVCSSNDFDGGVPVDSETHDCLSGCNCNYTCAMAQAGARYSQCFPHKYSPALVKHEWPEYCTKKNECGGNRCDSDKNEYCNLNQLSCLTDINERCMESLKSTNCSNCGTTSACQICTGPHQGPLRAAGCTNDDIQNWCSAG